MAQTKNVLLICGGGGTEHDISLVSAKYLKNKLAQIPQVHTHYLCIEKDGSRKNEMGQSCELRKAGEIFNRVTEETIKLDYVVPCFHGPPGETGQIQAVFEMMGLDYLGASSEGSITCFNKAATKLWLNYLGVKNSKFMVVNAYDYKEKLPQIRKFHEDCHNDVFIKATHQGSSVGCYHVTTDDAIVTSIEEALKLSPYVLIEETIKGRELEVAVFEYQGQIHASLPGEIVCPGRFYTFEEKYAENSKTKTLTVAPDISPEVSSLIQENAVRAFKGLNLKDLARVDFFLSDNKEVLINEINTFPGHTPISMFPMMMENYGVKYEDFLRDRIFTK